MADIIRTDYEKEWHYPEQQGGFFTKSIEDQTGLTDYLRLVIKKNKADPRDLVIACSKDAEIYKYYHYRNVDLDPINDSKIVSPKGF